MTKLEITKPKFGEMKQIASDLFWVQFELPFRLNHVNLFLMDTPTGWLIIDAGLKSDHSIDHWNALRTDINKAYSLKAFIPSKTDWIIIFNKNSDFKKIRERTFYC